jgi:hypothetical protein
MRLSRAPVCLLIAATAWLAACGTESSSGTTHTFADQGRVCLFPDGVDPGTPFLPPTGAVAFAADRPAQITVMAPTCLSSSCSHDIQAACMATLAGNVIQVSSTASYVEQGNVCTTDCGALVARCATPPLPAGTYQVRLGAQTLILTVPAMIAPPCVGQAP